MNKQRVQKILFKLKLFLIFLLCIFLYSKKLTTDHRNFVSDTVKIEVNINAAPFIALEEVNSDYQNDEIAPDQEPVLLQVGPALLPKIELEEFVITELESNTQLQELNNPEKKIVVFSPDTKEHKEISLDQSTYGEVLQSKNEIEADQEVTEKLKNTLISSANKVTLQGQIEFERNSDPLLVLTPEHRIEIRRVSEGVAHEFGEVKPQSGTFSIDIENKYGTLVAQLINSQGVVEGETSLPLSKFFENQNSNKLSKLILKPAKKPIITASSAYGRQYQDQFFSQIMFNEINSPFHATDIGKDTGTIIANKFSSSDKDNSVVIQASAPSHVPTTAVISLHTGADLMLMPDKMLENFVQILNDQGVKLDLDKGDSLIWGTVKQKGNPVTGATVYSSRSEPIYLGSLWMPDSGITKTTDSGMFIIVVKEPGWKNLFIQQEDGSQLHLNVLTFPGRISQVIAELPNQDIPVSLRSFDAFEGVPVRSRVQLQQVEDIIDTGENGLKVVQIPDTNNLSMINIFPEPPYMDSKQAYTKLDDYIHIPLIRTDWIEHVKAEKRINASFEKGIVVGFVQNVDFNLVSTNEDQKSENLVYFNSNGEVVSTGAAGGGFILFNQENEFETVTIKNKKNNRTFNKLAFPDNRSIFILNFTL